MAAIFFDTSATLAANATYDAANSGVQPANTVGNGGGMVRDATTVTETDRFGAVAHSDVAGTLYIDGAFAVTGPWRQVGSAPWVASGIAVDIDVPVRFRYYRVRYINGATGTGAGAFAIHSSFRR